MGCIGTCAIACHETVLLRRRPSGVHSNSPTNRRPIFPPSHIAHALPRQVSRWIRGPSVAPLCERAWSTNGTLFVMSPSARNGAKRRGCCLELDGITASIRARFLGGGWGWVTLFAPMVLQGRPRGIIKVKRAVSHPETRAMPEAEHRDRGANGLSRSSRGRRNFVPVIELRLD